MTLGEKLKKARADCGMSQSQVCGSFITRNMLSQLEHDQASPSLKTLEYLASVLRVPVSWLIGEDEIICRHEALKHVRQLYANGDYEGCIAQLSEFSDLSEEEQFLLYRSTFQSANGLFQSGQPDRALIFLQKALSLAEDCLYCDAWNRAEVQNLIIQCLIALHKSAASACREFLEQCQSLHLEEWIHLAAAQLAIETHDLPLAEQTLRLCSPDAEQSLCVYNMLKGKLLILQSQFSQALPYLREAEAHMTSSFSMELYRLLEQGYKETEDYKMAYHYASLRLQAQ